jgi:hypothetical protein
MRKLLTLIALAAVIFAVCSPASAQCSRMGGGVLVCDRAPAPSGPALTFIGNGTIAQSNASTITSAATVNIGTASATRRVIVVFFLGNINNGGGAAITGVPTIDGGAGGGPQNATVHYDVQDSATGTWTACISAIVATGTTGTTIAITTNSGGIFGTAFYGVYTTDNSQLVSGTPVTNTNSTASATTLAASVSVSPTAGGFLIGTGVLAANGNPLAASGYTVDAFGGNSQLIFFSKSGLSTGTNTATLTWTGATGAAMGIAAWR